MLRAKSFPKRIAIAMDSTSKTVWPSGLRRWLKAPVRKGVGSNPTAVIPDRPWVEAVGANQHHSYRQLLGLWLSKDLPSASASGFEFAS